MKKILFAVAGVCAFVGTSTLASNVYKSVVKIVSYSHNELLNTYVPSGYGSAVVIDNDTIVTNAHVILGSDKKPTGLYQVCVSYDLEKSPRCSFSATLDRYNTDTDLAILNVSSLGNDSFPSRILLDSNPSISDSVRVVGYPSNGGSTITVTKGSVSGKEKNLYKTDAKIDAGNSGGAALNSSDKLVGVPVAVRVNRDTLGYMIPVSVVQDFVDGRTSSQKYTQNVPGAFRTYLSAMLEMQKSDTITNNYITLKNFDAHNFAYSEHINSDTTGLYRYVLLHKKKDIVFSLERVAVDVESSNDVKGVLKTLMNGESYKTVSLNGKEWYEIKDSRAGLRLSLYSYVENYGFVRAVIVSDQSDVSDAYNLLKTLEFSSYRRSNAVVYNLPFLSLPQPSGVVTIVSLSSDGESMDYSFILNGKEVGSLIFKKSSTSINDYKTYKDYLASVASHKKRLATTTGKKTPTVIYGVDVNKKNMLIPYVKTDDMYEIFLDITDGTDYLDYVISFDGDAASVKKMKELFVDNLDISRHHSFAKRGYDAYEGDNEFYRGSVRPKPTSDTATGTTNTSTKPTRSKSGSKVDRNPDKVAFLDNEQFYRTLVNAISLDNAKKAICEMGFNNLKASFTDVNFSTREGQAIKKMADYCVVHGYNNDGKTFGLNNHLTKGQAYKIYTRMLVANHLKYRFSGGHWALEYYATGRKLDLWDGIQNPGLLDDMITLGDFVRIFQNISHAVDNIQYQKTGAAPQTKKVDYTKLQGVYVKRGTAVELISFLVDRLYKK